MEPLVRTEMSRIERILEQRIQYMIDKLVAGGL